jgi:hypothetical protein
MRRPSRKFSPDRFCEEAGIARTGAIAAPTMPFGYVEYFRTVPGGVQLAVFGHGADPMGSIYLHMVEHLKNAPQPESDFSANESAYDGRGSDYILGAIRDGSRSCSAIRHQALPRHLRA